MRHSDVNAPAPESETAPRSETAPESETAPRSETAPESASGSMPDTAAEATTSVFVTVHGSAETVDRSSNRIPLAIGLVLILILFAVGAAGLGRSLAPARGEDVVLVVLPRSSGRPASEVQKQLENMGLYVEISYASNESAPPDTVTAQKPIAGSRIEVGQLVTLTVSDGPAGVKVPDAAGLGPTAAANLLQVIGLTSTSEEVYDEKVRAGEVVATQPEAGARAAVGSNVVLKISKGPQPRVVPEVLGVDGAHAFALIGAAELQIGTVKHTVTASSPAGTIVSSSPAQGAEVPRSTPVDLVVADSPDQILVPDFVLMTSDSAASIASNLGLKLKTHSSAVAAGDTRAGIVLSQSTIAGSTVPGGTTIEVTVGSAPRPPSTTSPPTTVTPGG